MKRIWSIAVPVLLLILLLLPAGAKELPVREGEVRGQTVDHTVRLLAENPTQWDLRTTAEGLDFIKSHEGFAASPYDDYTQQTIGYGCNVTFAKKYGFSTSRLTKAEAHDLLICVVWEFEQKLDRYLDTYGIDLYDYEYDALLSFAFNCPDWLNGDNRITRLLTGGRYSVNEFASAMGIWCHAGGEILPGLVNRRIDEITLFLYGAYETDEPMFCALEYRGEGEPDNDIEVFRKGKPYGSFTDVTPPPGGYVFDGWYTEDGVLLEADDIVKADQVVYARWRTLYGYEILSLRAEDSRGNGLDGIPDGSFYLSAEICKAADAGESVLFLVTYSDRGQMLDSWFLRTDVPAGTVYGLGVWVNNKENRVGECRAFVLESLGSAVPLCEAAVLKK